MPSLRRGAGEAAQQAAQQLLGDPVRVIRGGGRRRGAPEALVAELVGCGVLNVVVESISALHPIPAKALATLAAMRAAGLTVSSIADPWTTTCDPQTLVMVATYLSAEEKRRNSRAGRAAVAVARVRHARIGRPPVPIEIERARALVEQHGSIRRAARELRVGASTLRRALRQAA